MNKTTTHDAYSVISSSLSSYWNISNANTTTTTTALIPSWMKDYFKWHHETRSTLTPDPWKDPATRPKLLILQCLRTIQPEMRRIGRSTQTFASTVVGSPSHPAIVLCALESTMSLGRIHECPRSRFIGLAVTGLVEEHGFGLDEKYSGYIPTDSFKMSSPS